MSVEIHFIFRWKERCNDKAGSPQSEPVFKKGEFVANAQLLIRIWRLHLLNRACEDCMHGREVHMTYRKVLHFMSAGAIAFGIVLCLPVALLAQTPASSQDSTAPQADTQGGTAISMHHNHRTSPTRQLKKMTKMLNLTPDQQQQMLPILQDRSTQMKAMQDNTSLSPQQRRQQGQTLMQETNQKLEAIMTDSQKQQYEQAMQQRRDQMHNGRMGQAPPSASEGTPPPQPDDQAPPPQ